MKAALILCFLICIQISPAQASTEHKIRGVVITRDGSVVPEFTVIVKPVTDKPELLQRRQFTDGEFTINGLAEDKYQLQISSSSFIPTSVNVDFKTEPHLTDYCIVILHSYRNEPRFLPGETQKISVKMLQRKLPQAAVEAYKKGVQLHTEGKLDDALIEYGKALRAYPQYLEALSDLGTIFILYNRPDSALAFLRRAHDIDEHNPIVNLNIAIALTEQGDYGAAMKLLKNVLRNEPRMALAQYYMARIHYTQRKYSEAEPFIRKAIENDPQLLDAWLLLINTNLELKNYDEARETLRRVRETIGNRMVTRFIDEQLSTLGS